MGLISRVYQLLRELNWDLHRLISRVGWDRRMQEALTERPFRELLLRSR